MTNQLNNSKDIRVLIQQIRKDLKGSDLSFATAYNFLERLRQAKLLLPEWGRLLNRYRNRYLKIIKTNPRINNVVGRYKYNLQNADTIVQSYSLNRYVATKVDILDPDEEVKYEESQEQKELRQQRAAMDQLDARQQQAVEQWLQKYRDVYKNQKPRNKFYLGKIPVLNQLTDHETGKDKNWFEQGKEGLEGIGRKALNTIKSGAENAGRVVRDGSLAAVALGVPAAILNPAAVPAALTIGGIIGGARAITENGRNKINLRTFNANTVFDNDRVLSPWTKHMIRQALNNPANWGIRLDEIQNPAIQEFIKKEGLLNRGRIDPKLVDDKYRNFRIIDGFVKDLPVTAGTFAITAAVTGNPLAAATLGAAVGGYRLYNNLKVQQDNIKYADELIQLARKPEVSVVENKGSIGGKVRISAEEREILKQEAQKLPQFAKTIVAISKNVENKLRLPSPTKLIEKTMIKWNRLPPLVKYAPILVPLVFMIGGPVFGYGLTMATVIQALGIGIGATSIGILTENDDKLFKKKYKKERFVSDTALNISRASSKIDKFLNFLTPAFGQIGKFLGYVGVIFFVKSVWDLFNHGIRKFSDYAKVAGLVVSFIMSYPVFKEIYDDMTLNSPQPVSEEMVEGYFQGRNTSTFAQTQNQVYDCFESQEIPPMEIEILDIVQNKRNDQIFVNIRGRVEDAQYIYKNVIPSDTNLRLGDRILTKESFSCS
jgi:hypothetical protein